MARDLDAIAGHTHHRAEELARAFDVDVAELVALEREAFEALFAEPDWALEPLSPLELYPRAGGRLVEVTGPDRAPPIRASAAGEALELDLTLANLGGTWRLVR